MRGTILQTKSTRERLLATTMIGGALALALGAAPAFAQSQSGQPINEQAQSGPIEGQPPIETNAAGQSTEVGEIVITGSRISQPNLTSVSPVTVVGSQDVQLQGITRSEDLLNRLPQVFAAQGSAISNGASGTATVDLRGLGAQRTLVLIDGRRLMPGDIASPTPDLNFIPSALIDRVEVYTGGASAVYGADAVAGVVNFIMQRNFEGFRVDAQYSFYQHENDNDRAQTTIRNRLAQGGSPAFFRLPERDVTDGYGREITAVIGSNSADGRGNVTAYASWRNIDPVVQSNRDYSACALNTSAASPTGFTCGGSGTTAPARFITAGGTGRDLTIDRTTGAVRAYNANTDAFNFAPYNFYQRNDERYTLGAFAHYELSPMADVYGQFMFMDNRTNAVIAPSGIFLQTVNVNCTGNPLLPTTGALFTALCGPTVDQNPVTPGIQTDADAVTPGQQAAVAIGRRNVEGGGRNNDLRHTDYRIVLGVRGDVGQGWRYDAYAQFGRVLFKSTYFNDFSVARVGRALDIVAGPTGAPVCRSALSGLDAACVPYNIFNLTGPSQAALDYLQTPGFQDGTTEETVVSASVTGDLGQYGLRSPFATDGVGVALGAEYRREFLERRVDTAFRTGDLAGQGGATLPIQGDFDLYELFGELRIPLASDMPFIRSLNLELGYRFSDYNLGFDTSTYKVAGEWAPIDGLRFRAGYNRAVRAPNIVELFSSQNVVLDGTDDPCAGAAPRFNLAQCQRTGVTAAQYGNIIPNTSNQYNGLTGGNPNLAPEVADSRTLGVVWTPSFLPRFSVSVDYYNIELEGRIGGVGADLALEQCGLTGDPFFCSLIVRAPGTGSLWLSNNGYVIDTNLNTGALEVSGVDIEANYRFEFADFGFTSFASNYGGLSLNYVGSYLDEYRAQPLPNSDSFDCAGQYGAICTGTGVATSAPLNRYRHQARATWNTPWRVTASVNWRYLSEVDNSNGTSGLQDSTLDARHYFDLSAVYRAWTGVAFRVGVNNVFDRDPPLVGSASCPAGPCNGNVYSQTYDALGRYFFFGVSADF